MITLLTGNPGAGKTAQLVEWLRTLYTDRPIYSHGLNGLKLDHTPVNAAHWHTEVPDGAILVIDEVQDVWRPRGPGHAVPDSIKALETHRHRGIDIFLTTQKPKLVDGNVRELVGRHVHIRDTGWLGRWVYEWPECSENIAWKTCAVKRRFKLPTKAFALYKSATVHSSAEKIKSRMVIGAGLAVLAAVLLAFLVYRIVSGHTRATSPVAAATEQQEPIKAAGRGEAQPKPAEAIARDSWPVYEAAAHRSIPDPYAGRGFQIEGRVVRGDEVLAFFGLLIDGQRVATVTLAELVRMGYAWTELGPCAGVLRYENRERLVTCSKRTDADERRGERAARPAQPASSAGLFG